MLSFLTKLKGACCLEAHRSGDCKHAGGCGDCWLTEVEHAGGCGGLEQMPQALHRTGTGTGCRCLKRMRVGDGMNKMGWDT